MSVSYKPTGYSSVIPYMIIRDAAQAVKFYQEVFGAREVLRIDAPGGKIGHSELQIGDAKVFLADECPEGEFLGPMSIGGTAISLLIYVEDVDKVYEHAVSLGAEPLRPVADQFYGDRSGSVRDPFGHIWNLSTQVEEVSPEVMKERARELFGV